MEGIARYEFTHEILHNSEAEFKGRAQICFMVKIEEKYKASICEIKLQIQASVYYKQFSDELVLDQIFYFRLYKEGRIL